MNTENLLVLVDGSSYLFRAFHGLPKLTSRAGEPTGAIKGVISMIRRLSEDYNPSHIAIVFDAPGKTFRHEMFDQYKAHRPPIDEDLRVQIKPLLQLIESMGYPLIQIGGVEADDVIGTLAKEAVTKNMQVLISTGDKDLAQLIDGNTKLLDTMKMQITDYETVASRFKVENLRADQVVDFLALVGDTADNIPGIPKVGPKTAAKWLEEYGSVDNIIKNKDQIKGKVGENLRNNIDQLLLSRDLTEIKLDVDLPDIEIQNLSMNAVDESVFSGLCQRFDLNQIYNQVLGAKQVDLPKQLSKQIIETKYRVIQDKEQLSDFLDRAKTENKLYFHGIGSDTHYTKAELIGIGFGFGAGDCYYLPLISTEGENHLAITDVLTELKQLFIENTPKITFDAKYQLHLLGRYGIYIHQLLDDIMLAGYVFNSTGSKHTIFSMADKYLQFRMLDPDIVIGKGAKKKAISTLELAKVGPFIAEQVDMIIRLADYFLLRIDSMPGLSKVYRQIEMPSLFVLQQIETRGIMVDVDRLLIQSKEIQLKIDQLEAEAFELVGGKFNLNSPKQLQEVLFEKMALPVVKKTPKGQPSTNEEVLHELAASYRLPQIIIENRALTKLKNTYIDRLPEVIQVATNRIHTTYHQAVTSTGRLSSSDPNLQNIPIRTLEGRKIRQAFIAPKDYLIMASDYSQIELRIMAHLSQDDGLIQAFLQGRDIHSQTAAEIFSLSEVDSEHRRRAKAINFGLIYGMSAFGLAKQLGVSRTEAGEYIEAYFKRYPKVKEFMKNISGFAKELGYVETICGRRLHIPDITSSNAIRRNAAERLAINAPMQGSAADIIKIAMNQVMDFIADKKDIKMIMQVHDELVFEVKEDQADNYQKQITQIMENAIELSVPMLVETGVGATWDSAH